MSKFIHCNVSGTPSDTPEIFDDVPRVWPGVFNAEHTRCTFTLPDNATGGGHLRWKGQQVNFLLPADPGAYEGSSLGLPTIAYAPPVSALWPVCGATEFNLPAKLRNGDDIRPILQQRKRAGANRLRSLSGGYPFRSDQQYLTMDQLRRYWDTCADEGLSVLQCVFAGTAQVPGADNLNWQLSYWAAVQATAAPYGDHVWLQLANEWNHGTQRIDPSKFSPSSANRCDHGPGLTDAHPVEPFWSLVTWHPRRDGTRGITNCDCYEFEAEPWPRSQPWLPGEMAKPEDYGFNPEYARQQGAHCGLNWGGCFHTNEGIRGEFWSEPVTRCAESFYRGCRGL